MYSFYFLSIRRTQVIDDESDYFASDSNQWLSKIEREAIQKREEELREFRHASRLSKKITIDFAGRKIVEDEDPLAEYHNKWVGKTRKVWENWGILTVKDLPSPQPHPLMSLLFLLIFRVIYSFGVETWMSN